MMRTYLPWILLISGAIFSSLTVVCFIVVIRAFRERRTTIFPIVRETAAVRIKRFTVLGVVLIVLAALSIGGWTATQRNLQPAQATRLDTPTPSPTGVAPATPSPTAAPAQDTPLPPSPTAKIVGSTTIVTPEATPTEAASQPAAISSPTPLTHIGPSATATTPPAATPTIPASVRANGSIGPIAFATGITSRRQPITPTTVFTAPEQIYAVFPYSGLKNGLPFSVVWYYQNREILRDESTWEWGTTDHSFVFIKPIGSGEYRLELAVGGIITSTGTFRVNP